eukprot:2045520-Amphidinium_carterae.1
MTQIIFQRISFHAYTFRLIPSNRIYQITHINCFCKVIRNLFGRHGIWGSLVLRSSHACYVATACWLLYTAIVAHAYQSMTVSGHLPQEEYRLLPVPLPVSAQTNSKGMKT